MKWAALVAAVAAVTAAGAAQATTVSYSSYGTFSNIRDCNGYSGGSANACSIGSVGGGTNNQLDMSGSNPSYLVANSKSGSVTVPPDDLGQIVGSLTWTNNASSHSDQDFNVKFTFNLSFNGSGDSQAFSLNITQPTNPTADNVFNLSNATLSNIGPYAVNGVSISNVHFALPSGATHTSYDGSNWVLAEGYTRTLNVVADIRATAVPEPASLAVLGVGLLGLGATVRRARRG